MLLGCVCAQPAVAEVRAGNPAVECALSPRTVLCGRAFVLRVDANGHAALHSPDGRVALDLPGWLLETSSGATRLRDCAARVDEQANADSTIIAITTNSPSWSTELRYVYDRRQSLLQIDLRVTYAVDLWLASGGLEVEPHPLLHILSGPRAIMADDENRNQQQTRFTERVLQARYPTGTEFCVHGRHYGARGVELLSPRAWLFYDGEAHCTVLARPSLEERHEFSQARRLAGQSDQMTVVLDFGSAGYGVSVNTFPGVRPAALTIVDDADGECRELLLAAYFGTSDTTDAAFGRGGLLGHGLRTTRTVFASSRLYDVWDRLHRAGVELALHTPSGFADSSFATREALADLVPRYGLRHWVDHAAAGNPEDLVSCGSHASGADPFYILDQLEAAGCEYGWVEHNMFRGFDAFSDRRELPHLLDALDDPNVPGQLWVYGRTGGVFFENHHQCMREVVTPAALDELARRAGLAILYTHTCVLGYEGKDVGYLAQKDGAWVVKPEAQKLFALLAERVAADELWVAPAAEVFDRLRAMEGLLLTPPEVVSANQRCWRLRNTSGLTIDQVGLQFQNSEAVTINGHTAELSADGWVVVPSIAAHEELLLEVSSAERPVRYSPNVLVSPNPCHGSTRLMCVPSSDGIPEWEIHDSAGRLIWQGRMARSSSGLSSVFWDGRDAEGRPVSSGCYWATHRGCAHCGSKAIVVLR
ncbi:MAG: hypothetical protein KBD56_08330 [Candidatus Eisenbacteria bacterium]|nr:hypothetical protein [Candidatus Eisenbacteria bacterium]